MLALLELPHTRVALVSGRALDSLEHVADLPDEVLLIGSHGVEIRLDSPDIELTLEPLVDLGLRIDTSNLSANTLRNWVKEFVIRKSNGLTLLFSSFGFKHGIPLDADYVFDVRCLPNPYYDKELRPYTGQDQVICDFLEQQASVQLMFDDISGFVERWLPSFVADNRSYLTVALGCTGGQHRSVYLVERLGKYFREREGKVMIRHRELEKA